MVNRTKKACLGLLVVSLLAFGMPVLADGASVPVPVADTSAVAQAATLTIADLPAPYAQTAQWLQDDIDSQLEVVARAERAALALAKADTVQGRANTALEAAKTATAAAEATVQAAKEAVTEVEALLAQLAGMRNLHEVHTQASAEYERVQALEQKANDALDEIEVALLSANAIHEETSAHLAEKKVTLQEMKDALEALKEKIAKPGEADDVDTLKADLEAAEKALAAFEEQIQQLETDVVRTSEAAAEVAKQHETAETEQRQAVSALEQASNALAQAKADLDTVQLTTEEIDANEATAKDELLKAQTALEKAEAELTGAKAEQTAKADALAQADEALSAAQAEKLAADQAHTELQAAWAVYADIPGAITDAERFPAMDILACASIEADMYTVHADGTTLYFFENGVLVDTIARRERDALADVTLTHTKQGHVAVRFIQANGKTAMHTLSDQAQILFTGTYSIVRVSDSMRGTVTYLGTGCNVTTVDMPPVAALVHVGEENPLRYATERLFESHGGR